MPTTWMYHPTLARNGRVFETEDAALLSEEWVDTPARFPGGRLHGAPPEATQAPQVSPLHRALEKAALAWLVDDDAIIDLRRAAEQIAEHRQALVTTPDAPKEPEPAKPPLPEAFDSVDAFMDAYIRHANLSADMPEIQREAAKKAGLEQYALVKLKVNIDRRRRIEDLHAQIIALEKERSPAS